MTDFESIKSFEEVSITEEGVDTQSFLDSSSGLVDLFDLLGSAVFGFVQTDLRTNIAGVRKRFEDHPDSSTSLEKMVLAEKVGGVKDATGCLGRLLRGLAFTLRALQTMRAEPDIPLSTCFRQAYTNTLSHHHGFVVRKVVSVAISAVPYRSDFYARISNSHKDDQESHARLDEKMGPWLDALERICVHMKTWLEERDLGKITM